MLIFKCFSESTFIINDYISLLKLSYIHTMYTFIHTFIHLFGDLLVSKCLPDIFLLVLFYVLSRFSRKRLFVSLWTVAHQAPLSMGFSRQEYWNGLPCPPPGALPDPGIEPTSLMSPALAGRFFTISATWDVSYPYHFS